MTRSSLRKRVAVLISGRGSNMQSLLRAAAHPDYPAEVVLVLSNIPGAGGLEIAAEAGITTATVDHKAFSKTGGKPAFEAELDRVLKAHEIELICLAGFMRLLSADFTTAWRDRILNIHPSLLPKYKGLNTHQRAIDAGDKVHGCSVHFVTEALDDGPVVLQAEVPILGDDTAETLADRVHVQEHIIYPEAVRRFALGELKPA